MNKLFESIYNECNRLTELKSGCFGIKKDGKVIEHYSFNSEAAALKKIEAFEEYDNDIGQRHEYEVVKPKTSNKTYNKFFDLED